MLPGNAMYEISVRRFFSASHILEGYTGKCERLHGHNWEVIAFFQARDLNALGLLMDFRKAKDFLDVIIEKLDHTHLNNEPPFGLAKINPSTENIARYIYQELKKSLQSTGVRLSRVTVGESRDCRASYFED